MTAKELIDNLKDLPPETRICVRGYEGGIDYAQILRQVKILHNANKEWYYGNHEELLDFDAKHFDEIVWVMQ
jgi:hypothetical protein